MNGTTLFQKLDKIIPAEMAELTIQEWTPTPFMIDVFVRDREREITAWCLNWIGGESSPMHGRMGSWRRSNVTMFGWSWFGFKTEQLMLQFQKQFPSPDKTT